MRELIKTIRGYVDGEIIIIFEDSYDYGSIPAYEECHDSFGTFTLTGHCEPEDAIWDRDLQDNYYTGIMLGVRNTLKALKDNPELIKEIK